MIKTEMVETETAEPRIRHFSDRGVMIQQIETGVLYEEAVDYMPCRYTYRETEIPIDEEITAEQAIDILFGGNGNAEGQNP